jgi:predicted ATPase
MVEALAGPSDGESPGVVRYLSSRMQGVSTLSRQILAAASVLNGMIDVSLLRTVSGRTEEEVVEGVEQLVGARLLAEIPETGNLRFTLDALETMAYGSTSLVRRRLLHTRAAAALEGLPWARGDARLSGMIAFHHQGAGNTDASSWYELAGDLARAVYAQEEARSFYEAAMAIGGTMTGTYILHSEKQPLLWLITTPPRPL